MKKIDCQEAHEAQDQAPLVSDEVFFQRQKILDRLFHGQLLSGTEIASAHPEMIFGH